MAQRLYSRRCDREQFENAAKITKYNGKLDLEKAPFVQTAFRWDWPTIQLTFCQNLSADSEKCKKKRFGNRPTMPLPVIL